MIRIHASGDYLSEMYFITNAVDWKNKTVQPLVPPDMCLWQADQDHEDNYLIDRDLTQSLTLIRGISEQYQQTAMVL